MRLRSLPAHVVLPSSVMMTSAHLQTALGVGRAIIHSWRRHGFPVGFRDGRNVMVFTDDVAHWCANHGSKVVRK